MKKLGNIAVLTVLLFAAGNAVKAQSNLKINLNYNYSMPLGNFKNDIINNGSPRGFSGDISYYFNKTWALGLGFGYQDYYQKISTRIVQYRRP